MNLSFVGSDLWAVVFLGDLCAFFFGALKFIGKLLLFNEIIFVQGI